jgi:hypothetical protein
MSILITYPHGLGDCLMLTPSIREYYNKFNEKVNVAILKRFKTSDIFKNNPYVDKVFYLNDPWHDYKNHVMGFKEVQNDAIRLAKENAIDKTIYLTQPPPRHKIIINSELLGLNLTSTKIDIFTSDKDKELANQVINDLVEDKSFGFIQTNTGAGVNKDLPKNFGKKWLGMNKGIKYFIEIGESFNFDDYNINVQFEILRKASGVCVPDSVFYHACSGLDKNIDFVYFGRGEDVYKRVGNLNKNITENVFYNMPKNI